MEKRAIISEKDTPPHEATSCAKSAAHLADDKNAVLELDSDARKALAKAVEKTLRS